MATPEQIKKLLSFRDGAVAGGHIWPEYAACEAALESAWGNSELAVQGNNLFGQKQHTPPTPPLFATISLPTREFLHGEWIEEQANWISFPSVAESFRERMEILRLLKVFYSDYALALSAATGEDYVIAVSRKWSTDPQRGDKVLEIYNAHRDVLVAPAR